MKDAPILSLAMALSTVGAGCMDFSGFDQPVELKTHVNDWRDEVIYQVLIDRFANGDAGNDYRVDLSAEGRYHGGDWKGLEDRLDYIERLGITALWISPVIKNVDTDAGFDGYHGYWAQDLAQLNPHFGDLAALRRLVDAAHKRGIKVIVDIVTNHMGQVFYYDINRNGEPDERVSGSGTTSPVGHINEYDPDFDPRGVQSFTSLGEAGPAPVIFTRDAKTNHWTPGPAPLDRPEAYNRKGRTYNFEDPDQLLHGDFPGGLKDVDTTRCDVKEAMVDSYTRWVELTDIDGFRIDTVKHVEAEFWRYFSQKVRKRLAAQGKTRFLMFGEAFDGRNDLVGSFTQRKLPSAEELARENECVTDGTSIGGDQLDSVFFFPQYYAAVRDVLQRGGATQGIATLWESRSTHYGTEAMAGGIDVAPQNALVNFLDNHDVPRFLYEGDESALKQALVFLFTAEGIPCVYYGTEQGLNGGNDPANREDLWKTGYAEDGVLFQWVQRLTALRADVSALRRGQVEVRYATEHTGDEPDAGMFAFERGAGEVLVVMNVHATQSKSVGVDGAPMTVSFEEGTKLVDALGSDVTTTVGAQQTVALTLESRQAVVLVPEGQ